MDIKDLAGFGEIGKVLIEKVSNAIGLGFEPIQLKRISKARAEADVEADKIRMLGRLDNITELQKRGISREIYELGMNQENIENILLGAPEYLNKDASPNNINEDWIRNFFDKAKLTSDLEMQQIWSRILAGEANNPGTFSKRTVNLMQSIEKEDAELFTKLCSFCFSVNGNIIAAIFDNNDSIYKEKGVTFTTLTHLESIGLIKFNWLSNYFLTEMNNKFIISYGGDLKKIDWEISLPEGTSKLNVGQVILTGIGEELSRIAIPELVIGFSEYITKKWSDSGIGIQIVDSHK